MTYGKFHNHKTLVLENKHLRLECLAEAGPRIVSLTPSWMGENLFAEVPDSVEHTEIGDYHFLGGHRLWHAPESMPRTYVPDNDGLEVKDVDDGIRLTGKIESETNIRKSMIVQISPDRPLVVVKHVLENVGQWHVRLAPWGITMMRPMGVAILPQQVGSIQVEGLLPNRRFSLWPYSRWDDRRLKLADDYILVKPDRTAAPFKIGYFNPHGWLGYAFDDALFIKRYGVRSEATYPDFGCNAEVYCNDRFLELEGLGPLAELAPRQSVVYTETWEVYQYSEVSKNMFGGKSLEELLR